MGHLGASVADLHDLILDTLIKSETAYSEAQKSPSKLRVYWLVALTCLLALALAGGGIATALAFRNSNAQYQSIQYTNCLQRNVAQQQSAEYLIRISIAVQRAAKQGDLLAKELNGILIPPGTPAKPVDCESLKP